MAEVVTPEDKKRAEVLERQAAERGESKWYLSFKEPQTQTSATGSPLHVVSAGYSMLDAAGTSNERSMEEGLGSARPSIAGRRSFGKFNKMVEVSRCRRVLFM